MYYPQQPKEPSGCFQTIMITRMILSILLIPTLALAAVLLGVLGVFYALTVHPLLALFVFLCMVGAIFVAFLWESKRVEREIPRDDK